MTSATIFLDDQPTTSAVAKVRRSACPPSSSFVRRIGALMESSGKTQRQIAMELGYLKPNIITMFKQGTTRVPPDKVALLASSLRADPDELLRLWFETYEPHMLPILERHVGAFLSARERQTLVELRGCVS